MVKFLGLRCASLVVAHGRTSFSACAFDTGDRENTAHCPVLRRMISVIDSLIGITGSGSSASSATGILGVLGGSALSEQA